MGSLAKGSAITFLTQVGGFLLAFVASIILARSLGPAGRGAYALAILIASVLAKVGSLGLEAANVYYGASRKEQLRDLISNSIIVALALGLSLIILSWTAFTLPRLRSYLQANAIPLPLLQLALVIVPLLLWCCASSSDLTKRLPVRYRYL
ncbi:MAG: oligosaccharide flippase family protein [Candidatus Hadarchaeota archaeon]|nr:oligosaccharide flippase family protein [Candidatus Hadarchaeota archaeon]